jgi:hypothetical protein
MSQRVLIGAHERNVVIQEGLTAAGARQANLRLVTAALAAAGLDHWVVRGTHALTSVVGVPERLRTAAVRVLEQLCADAGGYVSQTLPRPPLRRLPQDAAEADWAALGQASVLRLTWFRSEPTGSFVVGPEYGCEVEFWRADRRAGRLLAPRVNGCVRSIAVDSPVVEVPDHRFTPMAPHDGGPLWTTREDFGRPLPEDIDFPVDVVYTWVDGSDPDWLRRRAAATGRSYHPEAASDARYINRDELRYSLRSLHMFAPWVRNVFLVTDGQVPGWLDLTDPRIQVVDHRDIFSDPSVLPVYNSCAIESQLHHIDGLSEHFLYLNDDMFFAAPLTPQTFFMANGLSRFFLSQNRIPLGPVTDSDTPTDVMIKNNRELISRRFGRVITQGTQHVPYALRRSVLAEIEHEFPAEHRTTMASRFRAADNLTITYSLYHYYAFLTGRAVPGRVNYGYVQLAVPDLAARLARALARRDWDVLCLNDAYSTASEIRTQTAVVKPFLEAYFPVPSPFEKV